jgi:hypothetical protein
MLLCHDLCKSNAVPTYKYDQKKIKKITISTTAAERHDPDFLIGPRNKKRGKQGRPLKFFIHRFKLQASISDEIQPTEAGACLRRLPLHPRRFRIAN